MAIDNIISFNWEPIDTSDWYKIDGYNIGLAEYCPMLRIVYIIATYVESDGIPNISTHIIPSEKYRPATPWIGLAHLTYVNSTDAPQVMAVVSEFNGGLRILYSVHQKAYRIFMDLCYRV